MNLIGVSGYAGSGKNTVTSIIQYLTLPKEFSKNVSDCVTDITIGKGYCANKSMWKQVAFAEKLKQIASLLTGIPREKFEDQEFKNTFLSEEWNQRFETLPCGCDRVMDYWAEEGKCYNCKEPTKVEFIAMTVRQLLQKLGTEAMRDGLHTNVWVNALFADYKPQLELITKDIGLLDSEELFKKRENFEYHPNWIISDLRFANEYEAVKERGGICVRINRMYDTTIKAAKVKHIKALKHISETALDNYEFDYLLTNDGTIEDLVEEVKKMLMHFNII